MYIENQATGHSPPPITPHYPPAYCSLAYILSYFTGYVIEQPGHMTKTGRRGGGPTSVIGGEMHALSLALCRNLTVNTHGLRTFFMRKHGWPSVALVLGFFIIARLLLILKGYL